MEPLIIKSRDNLDLISYLTLPYGKTWKDIKNPLPMVLYVHGGPWDSVKWEFNDRFQFLADRGYLVLVVNYRGSTGFGKSFVNASDKQWGRKMQDDLIDSANWAKNNGIADKDKIAILGGSYGGYAVLAGLTFTPDFFACGIDIVGTSNLITAIKSIPPYWTSVLQKYKDKVGNPYTKEGEKFLKSISPLFLAHKIKRPLLIAQGANDPRVKKQESDQMVSAMKKNNIAVVYALYPDEGHGFLKSENRLSFEALLENFLAKHIGGRCEEFKDDLLQSSLQILEGEDELFLEKS